MNSMADTIRLPAVAGTFYPAQPAVLRDSIDRWLAAARIEDESRTCPRAIVVPHAGYVYSGEVAATAYAQLQRHCGGIRRVVLLGPSHRVPLQGLGTSEAAFWRTPLGDVPLDTATARELVRLPQVQPRDDAHAGEHSLEVQLPFLQRVLGDFLLLPLVVGHATPREVAEVLDECTQDPHTLVVISTDLSHYLDYDTCQRVDRVTCEAIEALAGDLIGNEQACGSHPLRGLLLAAHRAHLSPVTLRLCNSGDTAGDKRRVVGYGAWAFYPAPARAA